MGRPSKRRRKIRTKSEFDLLYTNQRPQSPMSSSGVWTWQLEDIRAARDAQILGRFLEPVALAVAMRTDPALFTAYSNRLAPLEALAIELRAANESALAKRIAHEGDAHFGPKGIGITKATIGALHGCLANHGIAVGVNTTSVREDGSRIDIEANYWPLEHVRWDPTSRRLFTRVEGGPEIPIVHGDGRWFVISKREFEPWKHDACVLPGGLVWASHAIAARDWSKSSTAHGNAKLVGELAEGVALEDLEGNLSPEAKAFATMLRDLIDGDAAWGIQPAGSKLDFVTNNSTAWQVFKELSLEAEKAAARIYLGTDGTLGAAGGAPGVDISVLFGVATTKIQSDVECIDRAIHTGVIEPWTALNFGDSTLAPIRSYVLPDPDADAVRDSTAKRWEGFHSAVEKYRANGFFVDQAVIDRIAADFGVAPPQLPEKKTEAPSIALAPTDLAGVVTVNEARASAGLGELATNGVRDPDGDLTIEAFKAKRAAPPAGAPPSNGAPLKPAPTSAPS